MLLQHQLHYTKGIIIKNTKHPHAQFSISPEYKEFQAEKEGEAFISISFCSTAT
jgi:hypothetical protein